MQLSGWIHRSSQDEQSDDLRSNRDGCNHEHVPRFRASARARRRYQRIGEGSITRASLNSDFSQLVNVVRGDWAILLDNLAARIRHSQHICGSQQRTRILRNVWNGDLALKWFV